MLPVPPVRVLAVRTPSVGVGFADSSDVRMALDSMERQTSGNCAFAWGGAASGFSILKGAWVKASKGVG